jgi:flagellar hook-length control protein FliK
MPLRVPLRQASENIHQRPKPVLNPAAATVAFQMSPSVADMERAQWRFASVEPDNMPDVRGHSEVQTLLRGSVDGSLSRFELPRHISHQIKDALHRSTARQIEFQLSPVELGRVKISIQTVDGAVSVLIAADRPDTIDLMRRHLDLLAADFREIGFHEARFTFSEGQRDERSDESEPQDQKASGGVMDQSTLAGLNMDDVSTVTLTLGNRVDIRI